MKLELSEVDFVKKCVENANISARDAVFVGTLLTKVNKEFDRLEKLKEKDALKLPK